MPITIRCPKCQQILKVADEHAGLQVRCPGCQAVLQVPRIAAPLPVPAAIPAEESVDEVLAVEADEGVAEIPEKRATVSQRPKEQADGAPANPFDFGESKPRDNDRSGVDEEEEENEVKSKPRRKLPRVSLACPRCRETMTVPGDEVGKNVRCVECRTLLVVPNPAPKWQKVNVGIVLLMFTMLGTFATLVIAVGLFSQYLLNLAPQAGGQRANPDLARTMIVVLIVSAPILWILFFAAAYQIAQAPTESGGRGWARGAFYAGGGSLVTVAGIVIGMWMGWVALMVAILRFAQHFDNPRLVKWARVCTGASAALPVVILLFGGAGVAVCAAFVSDNAWTTLGFIGIALLIMSVPYLIIHFVLLAGAWRMISGASSYRR